MTFIPEFGLAPRDDDEGLFSRDSNGQLIRLDKATKEDFLDIVEVKIDGTAVQVPIAVPLKDAQGNLVLDIQGNVTPRYTTILDAVNTYNRQRQSDQPEVYIPTLCHQQHMTPVAVCRLCMVEVWGRKDGKRRKERKLLPACQHQVKNGMEVFTMLAAAPDGDQVRRAVSMMTELLMTDHLKPAPPPAPADELDEFNELKQMADRVGLQGSRFKSDVFADGGRPLPVVKSPVGRRTLDASSPVFLVDHSACILCDRCSRACNEVKNNNVIGRTGKGRTAGIGFDLNDEMFGSSCVQCGECMISCPTSAITFKPGGAVKSRPDLAGEPIPLKKLRQDPLFAEVPPKLLLWQKGLVRELVLKTKKELYLCRQGDPGNCAYIIKDGGTLYVRQRDSRGRPGTPIPRTKEHVIVGEMACLSGVPRNADIYATSDVLVWEVRRNVLDRMMRSPKQRDYFERLYRDRALPTALNASDLFHGLPDEEYRGCLEFLQPRIEFVRVNPGELIFQQGDLADHMYLIRLGHVRVGIKQPGQEESMLFLGPGKVLGEMGILAISRTDANKSVDEVCRSLLAGLAAGNVPRGKRTATCSALDHVELARIDQSDFLKLAVKYPGLLHNVVTMALDRLRAPSVPQMHQFVEQGLFQGQSLLVLDLSRCTRCEECTKACVQQHGTETHGQPITRLLREGLRFGEHLVATACRSCKDANCMRGCPVDAIHRGKHQQIVIENHCIGCGLCAENCPYGSIFMEENKRELMEVVDPRRPGQTHAVPRPKAAACDLCDAAGNEAHPTPRCVFACPHDAAHRMTGKELLELVRAGSAGS